MRHALDEGDAVLERLDAADSEAPRADPRARGAAAARVPILALGPVFLVVESHRVLAIDPEALVELALEAVGPASALWLAREERLRRAAAKPS